ncbi:MAG: TRAP transporter small permease [Clostridia bacterium]|nr:TRAP transporter small permease [Clostridia bacterium]
MSKISILAEKISHKLDLLARALLVALMLLIVGNVIFRMFGRPIAATVEWAEFLSAMSIGLAVAYCGVKGGHLSIEFVVEKFNKKVQAVIGIIMNFIVLIFVSLSFWRLIVYANDAKLSGQVSMTSQTPYYFFIYLVAFGFLAYGLVIVGALIDDIRKGESR